jgi:competence protein ComEC
MMILLMLLFSSSVRADELIVWNVGQGLWVTQVEKSRCLHFDTGGERAPGRSLEKLCQGKDNLYLFSHWDWDHVGLVQKAFHRLQNSCVLRAPAGEANEKRQELFSSLQPCSIRWPSEIQELKSSTKARTSNDASRVFVLRNVVLPGDSTSKREKDWSLNFSVHKASLLILGHHGSRTSTSAKLLEKMPELKQAVASARKQKYGHPHVQVVTRLKLKGIALLSTEEWGTLHFEMKPSKK